LDIEMTGSAGSHGASLGSVGLDTGNPLEALTEAIGEALGLTPEPGSVFAAAAPRAPEWQIEAGA
jgi:hypothetical protein